MFIDRLRGAIANLAIISLTITLSGESAFCQSIKPDNTLKSENSLNNTNTGIVINGISIDLIQGGAKRGSNLFHSFENFNVEEGKGVYFDNPNGIERIITRVTGNSRSEIMGVLGVYGGNADLFLINSNGILFGRNSSLDLNGSFLATTANSLIFSDTQYSTTDPLSNPTLSVNIPIGLRFGDRPGKIISQSQTPKVFFGFLVPYGLEVKPNKTLALVGGDVSMYGGLITAPSARIEIGSVAEFGQVDLSQTEKGWSLQYNDSQNLGNIQLLQKSAINAFDNSSINLKGKNITIANDSIVAAIAFSESAGGTINISATETFELITDNPRRPASLITQTYSTANGGDIKIDANSVILRNGSDITTATLSDGNAGNILIKTNKLDIVNGSFIETSTDGNGMSGNIQIGTSAFTAKSINISGVNSNTGFTSSLRAKSSSAGNAGNIILYTKSLKISDGAEITASSTGTGAAGNLDIFARSVLLDNQGSISARTRGGKGNIIFYDAHDIILRNNSSITTNAKGSANGGNITINTGVLLALSPTGADGSDIVAKADKGRGGNIVINAKGIFGIEKRIAKRGNHTNDIDASSLFGRSGQVDINTATNPNNGLTELPETVVDPDTRVAQNPCNRGWGNELTVSGRGGLPPSPSQDLSSEATQVKLVEPVQASNGTQNNPGTQEKTSSLNSVPEAVIGPARGWVYNKKGQVVLVAYDPTITGAQRLKVSPAGCPVP
jgi:filamentous hemagglutinin family protein